jgi:hypothetical protein
MRSVSLTFGLARLSLMVLLLTEFLSVERVAAGQYNFVRISGPPGEQFYSPPSLNNSGRLAFGNDSGVYSADESGFITIGQPGVGGLSTIRGDPHISDNGTVCFAATLPPPAYYATVAGSGGALTTIADSTGPLYTTWADDSINAAGVVAFSADVRGGVRSIFAGSGGPLTPVFIPDSASSAVFPSINDAGSIAFVNRTPSQQILYRSDNGVLTTIYSHSAGGIYSITPPSMNNQGQVAFSEVLSVSGTTAIYLGAGGPVSTVVDGSGPYSTFGIFKLNDLGQIAFVAALDSGIVGIFTGSDPVRDKVIAIGDPLDGTTVIALMFGDGFNNRGQVAFQAWLADGRGIEVRADPVPEPATLALFGIVILSLAVRRGGRG